MPRLAGLVFSPGFVQFDPAVDCPQDDIAILARPPVTVDTCPSGQVTDLAVTWPPSGPRSGTS